MGDSAAYFTSSQVADLFGIHLNTLSRWRKAGTVEFVKINKRVYLYPKKSIQKMLP